MPTRRSRLGHTAPVYDGKVYVIGGYDGDSCIATFELYDIENDSWDTSVPGAPETHSFPEPAVYDNKLWLFTGTVESTRIQRWSHSAVESDVTWLYVYQGRYDFEIGNPSTMDMTGDIYRWSASTGWQYLGTSINNKYNFDPAITSTALVENPNLAEPATKVSQGGVDEAGGELYQVDTRGLAVYAPITAGSGTILNDESENGRDGTATSGITWGSNSALSKPSVAFNGTEYAEFGDLAAFRPNNSDGGFTIMAEVTPTSTDLDSVGTIFSGKKRPASPMHSGSRPILNRRCTMGPILSRHRLQVWLVVGRPVLGTPIGAGCCTTVTSSDYT